MKVLVVGSGGREHAIAWKLAQSANVEKIFCCPGNAGTVEVAENLPSFSDFSKMADWALENDIALTVVGPEAPLAEGISDIFLEKGLKIFGPKKAAARLEASKSFAKEIMLASGVKTAEGKVFSSFEEAKSYVEEKGAPIVVKADGLAAGKGVVVASSESEAIDALKEMMLDKRFGDSGASVVIEKCLEGKESSVMAIVDGETVRPLVISRDFKRLQDNDEGPNTGGMGAISPSNVLPDSEAPKVMEKVFRPVLAELKKRGVDFCGFLYAGLMITPQGEANVLEFNCRLGDPETQVILARLESDLAELLLAAAEGKLSEKEIKNSPSAAACVVASSKGYPLKVEDGKEIEGLFKGRADQIVFQAGTRAEGEKVFTKGGRILVVTGLDKDLPTALKKAYQGLEEIQFEGMHYRSDIGQLGSS
jgi:phosphoribosylamine--glycine ligase